MSGLIQIQTLPNGVNVGWLAKAFEITPEYPIPSVIPPLRIQVVMTNMDSFNSIVAVYKEYTTDAIFSKNGTDIDVTGAVTDSWSID